MAAVKGVLSDFLIRFQTRFFRFWKIDSVELGPIDTGDVVTRFALESNKLKQRTSTIFLPDARGETSVYRTADMDEDSIWKLGAEEVAERNAKPLLGRADLVAGNALEIGLRVEPEPSEHPRHANIVGWPLAKQDKKDLAIRLAQRAIFSQRPAGPR